MAEAATKRLVCCVPFCRRTIGRPYDEWICGPHWRAVPAAVKLGRRKADRTYRRRFGNNPFWKYAAGSPDRIAAVDADRACRDAWAACKAAAIERAAGL